MKREASSSPENAPCNLEEAVSQGAEQTQPGEQASPRKRRHLVVPQDKFEQRKDLLAFLQAEQAAKETAKDMTIAKDGRIKLSSAYYDPECRTKTPTEQNPEDCKGVSQPREQNRVARSEPHTSGTLSPRAARNLKVRDTDSGDKKKRVIKVMRNLSGQKGYELPPRASGSVVEPPMSPQVLLDSTVDSLGTASRKIRSVERRPSAERKAPHAGNLSSENKTEAVLGKARSVKAMSAGQGGWSVTHVHGLRKPVPGSGGRRYVRSVVEPCPGLQDGDQENTGATVLTETVPHTKPVKADKTPATFSGTTSHRKLKGIIQSKLKQTDAIAVTGAPVPTNKARRRHDGRNVLQAMQQEQIANCTVPKVDENCSLQDIS